MNDQSRDGICRHERITTRTKTAIGAPRESTLHAFAVLPHGGVARNFIGIRDYEGATTGVIPIKTNEHDSSLILLQVLASSTFYQYWRSFGDGFHVTNDLIDRFPISRTLLRRCEENLGGAKRVWAGRKGYAKTTLNSGKLITSYDFTPAFADVR